MKKVVPILYSAPHVFAGDTTRKKNIIKTALILPLLGYRLVIDSSSLFIFTTVILLMATLLVEVIQALASKKWSGFDFSSIFDALIIALLLPDTNHYFTVVLLIFISMFLGRIAFGGLSSSFVSPIILFLALYYVSYPQQALIYDLEPTALVVLMLTAALVLFVLLDVGLFMLPLLVFLQMALIQAIVLTAWPLLLDPFIANLQASFVVRDVIIILAILTNPHFQPIDWRDKLLFSSLLALLVIALRFIWDEPFSLIFGLLTLSFIVIPLNQRRANLLFNKMPTKRGLPS